MLDFRRNSTVRNYSSRREQARLLAVVLPLGILAMLGALALTDGAALSRLWSAKGSLSHDAPQSGGTDTRLAAVQQPMHEDAIRIVPDAEQDDFAEKRLFPGVDHAWLGAIRDDRPFLPGKEHQAFFGLLRILQTTDEDQLEAASRGRVSFLQLFRQPEMYRGELVSVVGTIRQAHRVETAANDYGIEHYYKLVLQPADAEKDLMFLFALDVGEGFPLGEDVRVPVNATGFFYKRWAYQARDDIRTAPLLVVKTVVPQPTDVTSTAETESQAISAVAIAVILALAAVTFIFWRVKTKSPRAQLRDNVRLHGLEIPEDNTADKDSNTKSADHS